MSTIHEWTEGDFQTEENRHMYPFIEDENAYGVYGYGHQDKDEFARQLNRWDQEVGGLEPSEWNLYSAKNVQHLWAIPHPENEEERFTWKNEDKTEVTSETPGAFPITVIIR